MKDRIIIDNNQTIEQVSMTKYQSPADTEDRNHKSEGYCVARGAFLLTGGLGGRRCVFPRN